MAIFFSCILLRSLRPVYWPWVLSIVRALQQDLGMGIPSSACVRIRSTALSRRFTGFAVSENVIRLIVLLHAPVLKCDALHTERRLDDGVVNGAELLLLGQRDTLYRFAGIELVYAPSALAESV